MDSLRNQDMKTQFKAYHLIYKKTYSLDSAEGIRRYSIFKQNVKKINEHNASNSLYKKGINHLTDMTSEEFVQYYNLRPMSSTEIKNKLRSLGLFDDYVDEEEVTIPKVIGKGPRTAIDHTPHMRPVRDQGSCGSCWSFATMGTVEGNWNLGHTNKLHDHLSTQHLVDCDTSNNGCDGGWYSGALKFLTKKKAFYEKTYPYTAVKGKCKVIRTTTSPVQLKGYAWSNNENYQDDTNWVSLLNKGPIAVAIDATQDLQNYSSGIWNGTCSSEVNHAVIIVGYGVDSSSSTGFYIVRNSWSEQWGENGYVRVQDNDSNNQSCNLEKYAYQPSGFTS
jgi:C1A family cysteine protease